MLPSSLLEGKPSIFIYQYFTILHHDFSDDSEILRQCILLIPSSDSIHLFLKSEHQTNTTTHQPKASHGTHESMGK